VTLQEQQYKATYESNTNTNTNSCPLKKEKLLEIKIYDGTHNFTLNNNSCFKYEEKFGVWTMDGRRQSVS